MFKRSYWKVGIVLVAASPAILLSCGSNGDAKSREAIDKTTSGKGDQHSSDVIEQSQIGSEFSFPENGDISASSVLNHPQYKDFLKRAEKAGVSNALVDSSVVETIRDGFELFWQGMEKNGKSSVYVHNKYPGVFSTVGHVTPIGQGISHIGPQLIQKIGLSEFGYVTKDGILNYQFKIFDATDPYFFVEINGKKEQVYPHWDYGDDSMNAFFVPFNHDNLETYTHWATQQGAIGMSANKAAIDLILKYVDDKGLITIPVNDIKDFSVSHLADVPFDPKNTSFSGSQIFNYMYQENKTYMRVRGMGVLKPV